MCRFSIRDILWLTALAAVATCWWGENQLHRIDQNRLNALKAEHHQLQRNHSDLNVELARGGFFSTVINGQRYVSRIHP